jgi:branched-chain amino acid transport system ATP-binding protein
MTDALLELRAVGARYGHIQALDGISLEVAHGSIICIIGSNGAGKSTLLKSVMGLVDIHAGQIFFDGHDITHRATHHMVKSWISLVPEGRQLFGPLSILDNLKLGTYKYNRRQRKQIHEESLERVYTLFPVLKARARDKAGNLSGGQQQMLAVGRALMSQPQLLLLDEPSIGLSPLLVREILATLIQLRRQGITIVLVEQNARLALKISDYAFVLETGRICARGPAAEMLDDENLKSAYLGKKKACQLN